MLSYRVVMHGWHCYRGRGMETARKRRRQPRRHWEKEENGAHVAPSKKRMGALKSLNRSAAAAMDSRGAAVGTNEKEEWCHCWCGNISNCYRCWSISPWKRGGLNCLFDYAMKFLCTTGTLLLFFHCFYLHFLSIIQLSLWFPPRYLS